MFISVALCSELWFGSPPYFSVLLIANLFIFCANCFHACFPLRSFATSALLTIKFVPNHEGIYQSLFRSVVSVEISGKQVFDQRSSAKISGKKGFDFLRAVVVFGFGCGLAALRPLRWLLVLLCVPLCPLWLKGFGCGSAPPCFSVSSVVDRLLSVLISENQRQKGFDFLRVSVPPR